MKITKQLTIKQYCQHNQQLNTIFKHSRLPEKANAHQCWPPMVTNIIKGGEPSPHQLDGLGEHSKLSQWGRRQSPRKISIWCIRSGLENRIKRSKQPECNGIKLLNMPIKFYERVKKRGILQHTQHSR